MLHNRQLSAIMFTDIVSYTALMDEDEEYALELLDKNRSIHISAIEQHHGKLLKEIGDGILASFTTVSDAVFCAIAIQKACLNIKNLQLRIGIHEGEVIVEENDVFGSGVNIASRLEQAATPGGIYISENVFRSIANRKEIEIAFVKEQLLKNVKYPLKIYEVKVDKPEPASVDATVSLKTQQQRKFDSPPSLAILPFTDMSPNRDQEFLGDGLAEELITVMSQIREVNVAGRTSSFSFKKKDMDLKTIGKLLNVKAILEGSVQKSGNHIRVTSQLINTEDGYHIWSQRYDREMGDVFAIEDDIISKIVEQLKITLLPANESKEERRPTSNMQAYEMLLNGRFYLEKRVEGLEQAKHYFEKAIELDPNYVDAYYNLGHTYELLAKYLFHSSKEGFEKVRMYAEKALSLDAEHANAHLLMSTFYFWYDWDWEKAAIEFEKAKRCPGYQYAHSDINIEPWYRAFIYGDFDFAINDKGKHAAIDPLLTENLLQLTQFNLYGRKYEAARTVAFKLLQYNTGHSEAYRHIASSYLHEGNYEKAIEYAHKSVEYGHGKGWSVPQLILALAASGKKAEAQQMFENWKSAIPSTRLPATALIVVNAYLGNMDEAFEWFEKAFADKEFWLVTLKYEPDWDVLRTDPRFAKMIERMHYPV